MNSGTLLYIKQPLYFTGQPITEEPSEAINVKALSIRIDVALQSILKMAQQMSHRRLVETWSKAGVLQHASWTLWQTAARETTKRASTNV